jgi:DNA-binding winged helix-turn-helix (wHTH) protein
MASPILRVGDLEVNRDTREVHRAGEAIELTPKEFAVLEYLIRHAGRVMSRTLITEYAWGYHFDPGTNIVDVVINHLRKKIDAKRNRKLITTVRGVGYVVKVGVSSIREAHVRHLVMLASMLAFAGRFLARQAGVRREAAQVAVTQATWRGDPVPPSAGAPQIIVSTAHRHGAQPGGRTLVETPAISSSSTTRVFTSRAVDDLYFRPGNEAQREMGTRGTGIRNAPSRCTTPIAPCVPMRDGELILAERRGPTPLSGAG